MHNDSDRQLSPTPDLYVQGNIFPSIRMKVLEGHASEGEVDLKPMLVGEDMLMVEIHEKAGVIIPEHTHDDHESLVYLVSGKMKLYIGDEEFIATAGDAWRHPIGVPHWSETLEDSIAIEIKSPPRKTWIGD